MGGKRLDEETRALVMAALLAGEGISSVSRRYSLPKSTVAGIRAALPNRIAQAGDEVRAGLDEMLLSALSANLAAQKAIATVMSETDYLQRHEPEGIAALYKTFADHSVRLLEAASANGSEEPEEA